MHKKITEVFIKARNLQFTRDNHLAWIQDAFYFDELHFFVNDGCDLKGIGTTRNHIYFFYFLFTSGQGIRQF